MPHSTLEARAAYQAEYRKKNKERLLEQRRARRAAKGQEREYFLEWYSQNKDRVRENSQIWRDNNRQKARDSRAEWRRANPDPHRVAQQKRRAQVASGGLTLKEWRELLEEFDNRCAYCQGQGKLEIEHMTPLSRGGPHVKANIVPACGTCNRRKSTHTIFEFLGSARGS